MSFVLFFRGLIGVLVAFAITTYFVTHSLWTTFIQTVICAVLLQIGYFLAVLFLVWREGRKPKGATNEAEAAKAPGDEARRLPGVPRSPHR
ncbi:exopolysaccharide production repressor protein [Pseudaminobacter soli (ex Li et al. 2025)]|uniref:Exopolysaccharide production repressor protein exox n=1 Tax=Pseudaminobacter soli (ex Li et al. 2025) TaxID=1295366 RepID=A0A2P7SGM0_9HYPH|nr:exopolysaccharide production repressor protein [Mesorhizobium soli]PSJ61620.1 exopolysaccharide production repressor protein exox [Mesorhizobium soli]